MQENIPVPDPVQDGGQFDITWLIFRSQSRLACNHVVKTRVERSLDRSKHERLRTAILAVDLLLVCRVPYPKFVQNTSSNRFNSNAKNYASSEVHITSPTISRLHELLPPVGSVCDVASGAGHTGLSFAGKASRLVALDPAPQMLEAVRKLAAGGNAQIEVVPSFAESISLESNSFDLVVCRLAAHHFTDIAKAMQEMTRIAKPGGYVAIIDMQGDEDPDLDALNHDIEVLHDPTHVRSYTAARWRELFRANELKVIAEEGRCWEIPGGLTVKRWCELGNSGQPALHAIEQRLASAPSHWLASLEISRDADGGFRIPVRTILLVGQKSLDHVCSATGPAKIEEGPKKH